MQGGLGRRLGADLEQPCGAVGGQLHQMRPRRELAFQKGRLRFGIKADHVHGVQRRQRGGGIKVGTHYAHVRQGDALVRGQRRLERKGSRDAIHQGR